MAVQVNYQGDLNCRSCDEIMKRERGCTERGILPFDFYGEMLWRCPKKMVSEQSYAYINAYNLYEKNLLPNGSAWLLESEKFLTAMQIIAGEIQNIDNEKAEKANKKRKR